MNANNETPSKYEHASFFQRCAYRNIAHDFYGVHFGVFGELYLICKGHGREGIEVISEMAYTTIKKHFDKLGETYIPVTEMKHALQDASKEILSYTAQRAWLKSYSVSVAFILVCSDGVFFANVGDCQILLLRKGKLTYLTKDNLLYKDLTMIDNNEELAIKGKNPVFNEAIGIVYERPEIIADVELQKNDCVLLATRGVFQRVTRMEILHAFQMKHLADGLSSIWESAQNKKSYDDYTMIALRINKPGSAPAKVKIDKKDKGKNEVKTTKRANEKAKNDTQSRGLVFLVIFIISIIILFLTGYPYLGTVVNLIGYGFKG